MAEGDFSVFAKIQADTSGFEKGMKKAQASANNLSNTFGNLSKIISKTLSFTGIVIGTKAVADFGKACVQSATQATKQFNILNNTIKATGADAWTNTKKMTELAKTLSDSTNYSITEIEKMQSVLLGFRDITDNFDEASEAILDMATVMGMDLTSAVQTVGKALDDPIKGLDSLRRQGFAFTDEQKAELAHLVKTGKKIEAQKIILDELSKSYGGAAKAGQDSFAKQSHAVENLKDTLGSKLIPTLKLFSENNASALNSLTKLIESMDFNKIGAVIKVSFDMVKEKTSQVINAFKPLGNVIKETFSGTDFKPIISNLNFLLEVLTKIGGSVGSRFETVTKSMENLKDSLANMTASIDFNKLQEAINIALSAVIFLNEEIQKVLDNLRENVKIAMLNVWNSIKSIFEASNKTLADSESDFKSWGSFFYDVLNNLFRTIQDVVYSVQYLLKGDWSVSWEYAKLAVLRTVGEILGAMDVMSTGFGEKMVGMLNIAKTVSFAFGTTTKAVTTALSSVEKLMEGSGNAKKKVDKQIEEVEKKIEGMTGDVPDKNLKDLDKFVSGSKNILGKFVDNFKEATDKAKKELDGLTEGGFQINTSGAEENAKEVYKIYSEWEAKLLQQRLDKLKESGKEYTEEYHRIQIAFIESERLKAEKADTTGKDLVAINEYYNKEIEKENKRFEKAKADKAEETKNTIINGFKTIAVNAVQVFKNVAATVKKVFSAISNIAKEAFEIFKFDPDKALDSLLEIEDTILTFFVETLPRLPQFFASAIQSIMVLLENLLSNINWDQVKEIIDSIVNVFVQNGPAIVSQLLDLVINIAQTLFDSFVQFVEGGGWKTLLDMFLTIQKKIEAFITENIDTLVNTLIDMLPDLIQMLIDSIVSASKTLAKIIRPLVKLIMEIINALIDFMLSDEVLDAGLEVLTALIEAIIGELIPRIIQLLPKLVLGIIKALPKILSKLVVAIVEGIVNAFVNTNWIQVIKDCFWGFVNAVKDFFGIHSPSTLFESFGEYMIEGLWNGIKNLSGWLWDNVKSFFTKIWDGIKNIFSNVKEWFGDVFSGAWSKTKEAWSKTKEWASGVWDDIKGGFGNVGDWFKNTFEDAVSKMKNAFSGIGDWFENLFSNIGSKVSSFFSKVGDGMKDLANKAGEKLSNVGGSIYNGTKNFVEKTKDNIQKAVEVTKEVTTNLVDKAKDGLQNVGKKLKDAGKTVANKVQNVWNKITGHAIGTNSAPRGLALVGEAGPELVRFRGGEQVLNAHNTQKALEGVGSKSNVFNVTFNNTMDTTAFAMMSQLKQYQRNLAFNGVL